MSRAFPTQSLLDPGSISVRRAAWVCGPPAEWVGHGRPQTCHLLWMVTWSLALCCSRRGLSFARGTRNPGCKSQRGRGQACRAADGTRVNLPSKCMGSPAGIIIRALDFTQKHKAKKHLFKKTAKSCGRMGPPGGPALWVTGGWVQGAAGALPDVPAHISQS